MKITKKTCLFLVGFLVALALSGCFDPVSAGRPAAEPASATTVEIESGQEFASPSGSPSDPEQAAEPDTKKAIPPQPFSVTITVGGEDGRAAAGSNVDFIINGHIRNTMQLIVVDKSTGKVHSVPSARQKSAENPSASLAVTSISYGKPYEFLLLMGHHERDYAAETGQGDYEYKYIDAPPTLLAAGFEEKAITSSENTVKITMWPIVVDTEFFTGGTTQDARVGTTLLTPGNWDIVWKIPQRSDGKDGFTDLIDAQQAVNGGNTLEYQNLKTIVRQGSGPDTTEDAALTAGNKITQNIGAYTGTAGNTGSANFNLEYVPFGKNAIWGDVEPPVWIIRNGVNDKAQDGNTTFAIPENSSSPWDGTTNGNGAVAFTIYSIPITSVSLPNLTLQIPKSGSNPAETLTATIEPPDTTDDKTVTWSITSSSSTGVAAVSTSGVVTGKKAGTATIKAVTVNGKEATCTVTVKAFTAVDSIALNKTALALQLSLSGSDPTETLTVIYTPDSPTTPGIIWSTTDGSVASVDSTGKVTGKKAGTAAITATSVDNSSARATCAVTVTIPATGISISQATLALEIGGTTTHTLTATVLPDTGTVNKTVTWESDKLGIATVNASTGLVTAITKGTATITARTHNGLTATCTVTVTDIRWQAGGSGRFVAVADGKAAWSADGGQTWREVTLPSTAIGAIAYGNGRFIVIGSGKVVISSDGGQTWAEKPVSYLLWENLVYKGGKTFVGIARDYSYATLITTNNGETWTETQNALPSVNGWYLSMAYGGGKFVAVSNDLAKAAVSSSGSYWSDAGKIVFPYKNYEASGGYIGYGGGRFVVIDNVTDGAAWSTDGTTWNPVRRPEAILWRGSGPFYGNGTFVVLPPWYAQNAGKKVFYSRTGGESWDTAFMPFQADWSNVAYGGGRFVAVSSDLAKVATSTMGSSWVTGGTLPSSGWTLITYGSPGEPGEP